MFTSRLIFFSFIGALVLSGLGLHAENTPSPSLPPTPEQLKAFAESREWKLLLHASPFSWRSGTRYNSEADGLLLFRAGREGAYDSLAELNATLSALRDNPIVPGAINQSARCLYPARRRLIREKLGLDFPDHCREFEEWYAEIRPERLSLVFAAPYMGSPASMFGHMFLRIHKKDNHEPLLDMTLGFEANTGISSNVVGYALRGLMGAYPGLFSLLPYHVKVNQYVHLDSRDLWEFPLNVDPERLQYLVEHLWEMQTTYFEYFFFDENCSYHLLSMLEVARPDWFLRNQFRAKAIPIDVVKAIVAEQKPLGPLRRRPAILEKIRRGLSGLDRSEQSLFYDYRYRLDEIPDSISRELLDVFIDWDQYQKFQKSQKLYDPAIQVNYRLLVLRSKLASGNGVDNAEDHAIPPHLGHASNKVALHVFHKQRPGIALSLRPAFHGITDWPEGYLSAAALEIADFQVEWEKGQKLRLEHLNFARVESLATFDRLQKDFSWKLGASLVKPFEERCERCLNGQIEGGWGLTQSLLSNLQSFMLASGELRISPRYNRWFQMLPFSRFGLLMNWGLMRVQLEHHWLFPLPSHVGSDLRVRDQRALAAIAVGQKNYEFKLSFRRAFLKKAPDRQELSLASALYF